MSSRPSPSKCAKARDAVEAWNYAHDVGTTVYVTQDDGTDVASTTRSPAWSTENADAVIQYTGRPGFYLLSRVRYRP